MIIYLILTFSNFLKPVSDKKIYYQILGLNLNLYNNAFNGKDYNYYNGKYLEEIDKENILRLIPKKGLKLFGDGSLSFLSFYYNFWNLEISLNWKTRGKIEKEVFELLLLGNRLNQGYQLKESKGEISLFSKIKSAFTFFSDNWYIVLGVNYLEGYYYWKSENNYLNLLTTKNFLNLYSQINYQKSSGGYGYGFDIDFKKRINEKMSFKIRIENLINKIFWQRGNRIGKIILIIDSLNLNKINTANYYSFAKEEKEVNRFVNNPASTKINLYLENKLKDYWEIDLGFVWAIKEFFKISSQSRYQIFNFLYLINSLNLYFPTSKDIPLENFSYEIGVGLGITIKKFHFFIFQEYYKGIWLNAKGFSFNILFGITLK